MSWFDVDKQGLAAILERRGKFFALAELISNAWDSGSERVDVRLNPIPGQPYAVLEVEDWGEGFADPKDAFTMFGRSRRAGDAFKRGRFDLGEKLVLAVCRTAEIRTVGWALRFEGDEKPRRIAHTPRSEGTLFRGEVRMTRDEYEACCDQVRRLIPPVVTDKGPNGVTTFNGRQIVRPELVAEFITRLPTEIAGEDGQMRRTTDKAAVQVFEASEGGDILELGVPVVESDNGYRVNVLQKIPLNMDRDNVTPAFLRAVNAALLNELHQHMTPEAAAAPWAQEAAGDARATPQAVKSVIEKRFGERAVIATPNDPIANAQAEAAGYTVIPGGALSGDLWGNIRKHQLLTPSSQVFPTPKPEDLAKLQAQKQPCPTCGRPM